MDEDMKNILGATSKYHASHTDGMDENTARLAENILISCLGMADPEGKLSPFFLPKEVAAQIAKDIQKKTLE